MSISLSVLVIVLVVTTYKRERDCILVYCCNVCSPLEHCLLKVFHRFYEAVIHVYKNKKVPGEIGDGPGWP